MARGGRRGRAPPKPTTDSAGPTPAQAWSRVLRWLELAQRTENEVALRLRRWGVEPVAAQHVIERLGEVGLLDDVAFAHAFARELLRRGLWGAAAEAKLRSRGIGTDLAREAWAAASGSTSPGSDLGAADGFARALDMGRARVRALPSEPAAARRRLYAYLARRGFSPVVSARVVNELIGAANQPAGSNDAESDECSTNGG